MFVRWQARKRRSPKYGPFGSVVYDERGRLLRLRRDGGGELKQDVHWAAILVESFRVDGKPRQRHVAYLGSITESGIEIVCQRGWFWDGVSEHLDRLANRISAEDRQRIEATLAAKVPRITQEQYGECVAGVEQFRQQAVAIAELLDGRRRRAR